MRRHNWLAGPALFLATAAFVLWQNSQIAILWDLSYLLDTSWRIALGQMPYRDFPLVHPPLTFLIQAALMRLGGRHYELQIAYVVLIGGLGTLVSWRILLLLLQDKVRYASAISILLAAPLVFLGIYSIYPHPIYDCDCAFAILLAVWALQRIATGGSQRGFIAGVLVAMPMFFKQNMGLPFALTVVAGILLLLALNWLGKASAESIATPVPLRMLAGICASAVAALALIQFTAGLKNYLHWTVTFASQRRLPGLAPLLAVYRQPSFAWTLPCVGLGAVLLCRPFARRLWLRILAFCLLAAPFVASVMFLFFDDDLDERGDNLLALWPMLLLLAAVLAIAELRKGITLGRLMPFILLAAIHGTFLSQQLWGSTYAIWPLVMILIAQMLAVLPRGTSRLPPAIAGVVCVTFLACGGLYAAGRERLNYVQNNEGPLVHATLPALAGMADRGPYLTDFEQLERFADKEIPVQDGILLLPGEEPFYFATGRTPQFPVQIFDNTTDPYSPDELIAEARERKIRWVIVKTRLQSTEDPLPEPEETMKLIQADFVLFKRLAGYDVYCRPSA